MSNSLSRFKIYLEMDITYEDIKRDIKKRTIR
jgi:hypothetical protein